ncbi:hypothetical protein J103_30270 [Burkholderia pseudomallei MSHR5855]|nr:hypothetical protein J103_30270 [Burkholderia pseudomallei MSHR5855]
MLLVDLVHFDCVLSRRSRAEIGEQPFVGTIILQALFDHMEQGFETSEFVSRLQHSPFEAGHFLVRHG